MKSTAGAKTVEITIVGILCDCHSWYLGGEITGEKSPANPDLIQSWNTTSQCPSLAVNQKFFQGMCPKCREEKRLKKRAGR